MIMQNDGDLSYESQKGAVVVEFALVALLLFVLLAGAFDYGMAWRAGLAINEGARTGARVGSAVGDAVDPDSEKALADYYALTGARSALQSSGKLDNVERVVIFRATSPEGGVPLECKTQSNPSRPCNIIDGATFRGSLSESQFRDDGCLRTTSYARRWCPGTRNSIQLEAEYFGIWIRYREDHHFPIVGSETMIERQAVMRIEPQLNG